MSPHRVLSTLSVLAVVSIVVVGTAAHLVTRRADDIDRTLSDARRTAETTARVVAGLRDAPRAVDDAIADQLSAQTALVDTLVGALEGQRGDAVNQRLAAVTTSGGPIAVLVTDGNGRTLYRGKPTPDVVPGPDGAPPAHGRAIGALIAGASSPVAVPVDRSGGATATRQAAERGSKGRLVQITADVTRAERLAEALSSSRLLELAVPDGDSAGVWFADGRPLARLQRSDAAVIDLDPATARRVASNRASEANVEPGSVVAVAPAPLADGTTAVVAIRRALPDAWAALREIWLVVGVATAVLIWLALLAAGRLARRLDAPLDELAAAARALSIGRFNPFSLNEGRERPGSAGDAARAFVEMARVVGDREDSLEARLVSSGNDPRL